MTIYTSIQDYINRVVNPALGDSAEDYDTHAIASWMTAWRNEYDRAGNIIAEKSGLKEVKTDFWATAKRYAR